jgi:molybdopterin molybdotransferase
LIPLDQALAFLAERLTPVVTPEHVPLAEACGRVLAEDVVAGANSPPFASAAMDGFAFRAADLPAGGESPLLPVVARVAAGHVATVRIGPGHAVRIFTGAPLPDGVDTVAMQEDCQVERRGEDELVRLPAGQARGTYVRQVGEDFTAGTVVLRAGRRLRPQDVAMAASVGRPHLSVFRRLRAAVFSTGDEVVEPGQALPPGKIYSSNRYALMALAGGLGCAVTDLGNLPDRLDVTRRALLSASEGHDLLITSGGVSVGGEDHVRDAVASAGTLHLWRMAIKPGKPTALGHVGKAAFIGLSGYPVAAQVTFMMLARPVILRLSGALAEPMLPWHFQVPSTFSFVKTTARRQFVRARLQVGDGGRSEAILYRSQEPNVVSSLVDSDGLINLGEEVRHVAPGDIVDFIPYQTVQW